MKKISLKSFHNTPAFVREGAPDETVAKQTLGSEFALICDLLKNVRRENLVLDFGGYIGTAAVKFATSIPHSTVVTVEPAPDNFEMLRLNTAPYSNIIAVNAGVSSQRGKMQLLSRGTGEWGYTLVADPKDNSRPQHVAEVDVLTVGDVIGMTSLVKMPISFAKIDIEGSEVALLRDVSWADSVAIIMAELHDRIVDGCSEAWENVQGLSGRITITDNGEKVISINPSLIKQLCS